MQASDDNPLKSMIKTEIEEWCAVDPVMTYSKIIDIVVNPQKEVEQEEEDFSTEISLWLMHGCFSLPISL